ncbi:MAG: pyruvate dehydrogenase (acetyl-transferring) E1 component subunit alpha [Deltaproteobacteria bacterium]|nr:pyruvate dehydrogenase (acetyl-transferring) E1 component subunit alpha [Deltaproteobacteria bacterium]
MQSGTDLMKKKIKNQATKSEKAPMSCSVLREDCFRLMNEDGTVDPKADPKLDKELLLKMYRNMALTRAFDERGMMLQRQGRIGFYVPSFGQEAIQTGTAAALVEKDWVFPSYREPGIFLYRGAGIYEMLCNLWGNQGDLSKGRQMPVHYSFPKIKMFSVSSPIATQLIQAVGAAMASKISKTKEVAISYCGDGGTSESDFHTALTFAGAYKAPSVFIVTNNQYAISVPLSKQTGAKKLADKAIGYGMPGIAVDGNDILAVYQATKEAVDRARRGEGPSLIECVTFRMGPHSSSDDPTRYRDEKLYQAWAKRDPIKRLRTYLESKKIWDEKKEKTLQEELKKKLAEAVERAEAEPLPDPMDLFEDVYAELTPQLKKQKEELLQEVQLRGQFENTSEAFPL